MLEPMAKKRDVRLQIDSANPPILAFFDRERVLRVLSNLVGNAVKFSHKHGKVAIRVRGDQQFAYISVIDSGSGIPEKNRAQLFDQYWQSPKTAEQGAGVGLAVVKTIVEAHGGIVRVDSQSGSGSTFTFSLPRRRPASAVIVKPTSTIKGVRTNSAVKTNSKDVTEQC
jgi:signal transduction histidine kinase